MTVWDRILGEDDFREPGPGCAKFPLGWNVYFDGTRVPFFARHQANRTIWAMQQQPSTYSTATWPPPTVVSNNSTTATFDAAAFDTTIFYDSLMWAPAWVQVRPERVEYLRPACTRSAHDLILDGYDLDEPDLPKKSWTIEDLKLFEHHLAQAPNGAQSSFVKDFQEAFGLPTDGILGPQTRHRLREILQGFGDRLKGAMVKPV